MLFDTTFLIDYEREVKRNRPGMAHAFLVRHPNAPLYISILSVACLQASPPRHRPRLRLFNASGSVSFRCRSSIRSSIRPVVYAACFL